jgi:8-oxo-dGTP pyrophosphatase MutT (NUDIX family)
MAEARNVPRYMSAGVILVDREGRVLMQLRDDNPKIMYPGHWGLTGGAALAGETPDQTAVREVLEETGLQVEGRLEPFRAYYFKEGGNGRGAKPTENRSRADYEVYVYHAPCETPVEELVCGEGRGLRYFSPEELDEIDVAYNHREVLGDFFGSPAYAPYLSGAAFEERERVDLVTEFVRSIRDGDPWFEALMRTIAQWVSPREHVDGRDFRYLIGGEAFDWLLLAERLLQAADDAIPGRIPAAEREQLVFEGKAPSHDVAERPSRLADERLRSLIGEHKHRAHLNYLYGVVIEQALQYAVEQDVAKERASVNIKDPRFEEEAGRDPIFERIYGKAMADLLLDFRASAALPQAPYVSLSELREFQYWLFKYRVKNQEPARVASDTRKALAQLSAIEAASGRPRTLASMPAT